MNYFVTGTDTHVGKTVVAAALAKSLQDQGKTVRYFKPVQTGVTADETGDAEFVGACGIPVTEGLRLRPPLAPTVAARLTNETIDYHALLRQSQELAAEVDDLVIEGAGGLLVPLAETEDGTRTMADFARDTGSALVVVVRPALGTLNHTALTLEAARARDLPVHAVVISGWPEQPDQTESTNLDELRKVANPVWRLPFAQDIDTARPGSVTVPALI